MKNIFFVLVGVVSILALSCKNPSPEKQYFYVNSDSLKGQLIADTIIYDVIIKNRDTADIWTESCLQYLNKSALVDSIFAAIYSGRRVAYDLFSGDIIDSETIRILEKEEGYSRDAIGKIQFREAWYFNSEHLLLDKQILSIVLGIEQYSELGEFRGYKPVMKVDFN